MSYNRVRTPKFYIDAVLLARQLGYIEQENPNGKYYLNPTKTTDIELDHVGRTWLNIKLTKRHFLNSITHCFVLGHALASHGLRVSAYITDESIATSNGLFNLTEINTDGFTKFEGTVDTSLNANRFTLHINGENNESNVETTPIGDISIGWSYEMPHTPDLELTQTFANESLKTQTTKGGHTLTNTGWNQPPMWGTRPQWRQGTDFVGYPARRSWSLKFSYLNDTDVMPQHYNEIMTPNANNRGIFERTTVSEPFAFNIKQDFLSKVYAGTNGFQLPFIFQPDSTVEEYAICRVNSPMSFNQVANNVYDVSLDVVEIW